ncbi:hypothetical protein JAO76_10805 [Pontibacter sp. BT310]|uniref:Membrane protein insertase YidC n=1 Tax=Pontibacter populi TaxID=890055 RepID=A0ABS6XC65_9BACT|nr:MULTISPECIES: hypothetical protein [Pontibacter]MBJ6118685.1 hypothetical protein [Pontibacter sp. BT310]MBR0571114.1 hypothetical protein [Microvirga sp. STS03]MBW3365539.1 hypothetical protein [Pontibacter populi]
MRNILPWILAAIFLFLAVYFYWQKNEAESRQTIADKQVAKIDSKLEHEQAETDSLKEMVLPPDTMELVPPGGAAFVDELGSLSQSDVQKLQRKGLKSPETDLMNDLNRKQNQLIPDKGTMGGTMTIRDSRILNDRYALAYYEDGHNGGYLLLKYTVNNGTINWTAVDNSKL